MAVNLLATRPEALLRVKGVELGVAEAGVRKTGRKDLLVMRLAGGAKVAGVFTQNRFCAAPVILCKDHVALGHPVRALLVNTGNANAGTGADGLERARRTPGEASTRSTGTSPIPARQERTRAACRAATPRP